METQTELLKRYQYLNNNKELILAECIIYDIEKKRLERNIDIAKSYFELIANCNNNEMNDLYNYLISSYEANLTTKKPYLSAVANDEYLDMMEELILGDTPLEETRLYKQIENIKADEKTLSEYNKKIDDLEERRNKNRHLQNIPTFTVWKILSYIRKKHLNNAVVSHALDKYYNLERYTLAGDECPYGYYIPDEAEDVQYGNYPSSSLYGNAYDSCVEFVYRGNEFEEEDNYDDSPFEVELTDYYYPTKFANALASCDIIRNKKEVIKTKRK